MSAPLSLDFSLPVVRRAWLRRILGPIDDAKWNDLARELFTWHYHRIPAYQRLCHAYDVTPRKLSSWREIPAVPQQLFKRERLFAYPHAEAAAIYETSGTTTGQPGRQHLLKTDLYGAVATEGARRAGFYREEMEFHFLTPSPREAPHSSLSAMFGFWQKASKRTGSPFWVRRGEFAFDNLRETLEKSAASRTTRQPIALCGTAFSFVHLLDAWADLPPLRLPPGSRLLETGGFKGRSREIAKAELYAQLARQFMLPTSAIWNEYGMSELSSQAYARGVSGLHSTSPWTRVLVCDPATGREVPPGERGLIRWIDLANIDSALALQTLDLAEATPRGFRLIGRLPRTEPRGCSLSAEDLAAKPGPASTRLATNSISNDEKARSIQATR